MKEFALRFRLATHDDVSKIVQMLSDDPLGVKRERFDDPLPETYIKAFKSIKDDPNNELVIATTGVDIAGFLQITFIPYLTYQGRWRALVEGVRVNKKFRGQGIGKRLFKWAIEPSPRQAAGNVLPVTAVLRSTGRIKKRFPVRSLTPPQAAGNALAIAVQRAIDRNCHLIQLTTDKQRPDAIKFCESLGFTASHEGMKLHFSI